MQYENSDGRLRLSEGVTYNECFHWMSFREMSITHMENKFGGTISNQI